MKEGERKTEQKEKEKGEGGGEEGKKEKKRRISPSLMEEEEEEQQPQQPLPALGVPLLRLCLLLPLSPDAPPGAKASRRPLGAPKSNGGGLLTRSSPGEAARTGLRSRGAQARDVPVPASRGRTAVGTFLPAPRAGGVSPSEEGSPISASGRAAPAYRPGSPLCRGRFRRPGAGMRLLRGGLGFLLRPGIRRGPGQPLYQQGQSPSPRTREYFYYVDHQGQVWGWGKALRGARGQRW